MLMARSSRIFSFAAAAAAAVCGDLGCIAAPDGLSGSDEGSAPAEVTEAAEAIRDRKGEEEQGCALHGHLLELVRTTTTKDELLVEVRLHSGTEGRLHHARSAPRVRLLRDGCADRAPQVVGVVDAESDRSSVLRVPLAGLPEGQLDLSFTVEGAEMVLLLRKKGADVVLETDDERYSDGNTEIGGVAQPCRRVR